MIWCECNAVCLVGQLDTVVQPGESLYTRMAANDEVKL